MQEHLGILLPRPLLAEVHQASGGNPFYALEIVRMLKRADVSVEAGQPLPVPESLHELVHGRVLSLTPESRDFLLAAAAHAHPTISITEAAAGVGRGVGLAPALEARIVELEGQRIRFTHPLLAAGVYETADPLRRAEIHARLAELLEDPEARAWQLAASVDQPDEAVAAALEEAAQHARARGAPRPAALLLDRARELTPSDRPDDAHRRAVDAAYLHFESGDSPRAEAQLRDAMAQLAPGPKRAGALMRLARVRSYHAQAEAAELFFQAVDESEGDREILAIAHEGVATCLFRLRERLNEAVEHAELASTLALELGNEDSPRRRLARGSWPETLLGRESAVATVTRALALREAAADRRVLAQPLFQAAVHWWWTDALATAHDTLVQLLQRADELGDESSAPYVLVLLGQVECALGDFESALARASRGRRRQSSPVSKPSWRTTSPSRASSRRIAGERTRPGRRHSARWTSCPKLAAALPSSWQRERSAISSLRSTLRTQPSLCSTTSVSHVRREGMVEPAAIRFVADQ